MQQGQLPDAPVGPLVEGHPATVQIVDRGEAVLPRFVRYAEKVMGVERKEGMSDKDVAEAGVVAMEEFYHRIGMPVNMRELGVEPTDEQIAILADGCARATGGSIGSAKALNQENMADVFRLAR